MPLLFLLSLPYKCVVNSKPSELQERKKVLPKKEYCSPVMAWRELIKGFWTNRSSKRSRDDKVFFPVPPPPLPPHEKNVSSCHLSLGINWVSCLFSWNETCLRLVSMFLGLVAKQVSTALLWVIFCTTSVLALPSIISCSTIPLTITCHKLVQVCS